MWQIYCITLKDFSFSGLAKGMPIDIRRPQSLVFFLIERVTKNDFAIFEKCSKKK